MVIEKIAVKTLRQEVYDQLRDKIISADILPGETITLQDLARKFGVSLMPVREALWQLIRTCFRMDQLYKKGSCMSRIKKKKSQDMGCFLKTSCEDRDKEIFHVQLRGDLQLHGRSGVVATPQQVAGSGLEKMRGR